MTNVPVTLCRTYNIFAADFSCPLADSDPSCSSLTTRPTSALVRLDVVVEAPGSCWSILLGFIDVEVVKLSCSRGGWHVPSFPPSWLHSKKTASLCHMPKNRQRQTELVRTGLSGSSVACSILKEADVQFYRLVFLNTGGPDKHAITQG